jgi:hypothetical protein
LQARRQLLQQEADAHRPGETYLVPMGGHGMQVVPPGIALRAISPSLNRAMSPRGLSPRPLSPSRRGPAQMTAAPDFGVPMPSSMPHGGNASAWTVQRGARVSNGGQPTSAEQSWFF